MANVVIPALSNCLLLADCDMMKMSNSDQNHKMSVMTDMSEMKDAHDSMKSNSDHCESMNDLPAYLLTDHEISACECLEIAFNELESIIPQLKTLQNVDVRELIHMNEIDSKHDQETIMFIQLETDPSPPDLFIQFESLLI